MLKKILNHLIHRKNTAEPEQTKSQHAKWKSHHQKRPSFELGNGFYWEFEEVRNGYGGYKTVNAYLLKRDDPGFIRCIVNHAGEIQNFPGFKDRSWESELEIPSGDQSVHFVFWISPFHEGKACVRWLLQPDGRYFEDEDGFGAEHFDEIEVYSSLDEDGKFTEPFFLK